MFIYGKFGNESATVTVTIKNAETQATVVNAQATTNVGDGLYQYNFSARDNTLSYFVVFNNTTDSSKAVGSIEPDLDVSTLATQDSVNAIPTNPVLVSDTRLNNLDATISSRLATSGYTAPNNTQFTAADRSALNALTNYDDTTVKNLINGLNNISASDVWNVASRTITNTEFGLSAATIDAIATEVEAHLIDEADGQTIVNSIVGAIGNTNIDEVALVASIRADLERSNGKIDLIKAKTDTLVNTDISSLATTANINSLNNLSQSDVHSALDSYSNKDGYKADTSLLATSASINALNDFDPANDVVARVTLVDTTTVNTDMVTPIKMTESEFHNALDSYSNKSDYKTDTSSLATSSELAIVNDNVKDASLLIPASREI
jgi:hypothetical protein